MVTARLNGENFHRHPDLFTGVMRLCDDCGEALPARHSSVNCQACVRILFDNHDLWLRLMGLQ